MKLMHENEVEPDWLAGISIGAINAAIIAGSPRERRIANLRDFWHTVSSSLNFGWSSSRTTPSAVSRTMPQRS